MHDGRRRPRQLDDQLGELLHGVLVRVADVGGICVAVHEQLVDPIHLVRGIAEAARLRAIAVDGERLARQRLHDEIGDDATVARPHAGAIRVEDADDARVHAVVGVIGHRDGFGKSLCLVIDTARTHGVYVAPIRLGLRVHERIAVHLRRGGEKEPGPLGLGEAEGVVRAQRAHLERLDWQLEVVDGTRGRREVQHASQLARHVGEGGDIVPDELEPAIAHEVGDVVRVSRHEVVEPHDAVPFREEPVAQMRSQEARRTRDEDSHVDLPRPIDA